MGLQKWDGTSKMGLQNGTPNLVSKEASMGKKHARLCFIPICQCVLEILHFERFFACLSQGEWVAVDHQRP